MKSAKAQIEVTFDSNKDAQVIFEALMPELHSAPSDKADAKLEIEKNKVLVTISAEDASAFRAAINTYLRWIKVSKSLMEV